MLLIRLLALLAIALPFASSATAAGRYFAPDQESASGVIAADASGALHAAYSGYDGVASSVVTYRYCASACETEGNWQSLPLPFSEPELVQIAVTPDGRPRLMIQSSMFVAGASVLFSYAECNTACTDAASWTIVPIANKAEETLGGLFQYRINEHSFALDASGRPWFVYTDANYGAEPDHYGTFLTTCAADCTDPENWTDTNVAVRLPEQYTTESWDQVALAVTPDGRPRLLGKVWALDADGNQIENVYRIQVMNATEKPQTFQIAVEDLTGLQIVSDKSVTVDGAQSLWVPVQLRLPYGSAKSGSHTIHFRVASPGVGEVREKSIFMVPR